MVALGRIALRRVGRSVRGIAGLTLIRLIWRRISRVVSMLLVRSPLRRIALILGRHLWSLLLLRRNSGTSRPSLGLPRNGRSLVGRRLTGG